MGGSSVGPNHSTAQQHSTKYDAFLGYSRATDMPNDKSLNEAMANLAMHDLKSMNAIDSNINDNFIDRMKSVQTERAIVKSNEFVKQQQHQHHQQHHHNHHQQQQYQQNPSALSKMVSNQWISSTSPDPLIKPFNYKTDSNNASKEILWASTQSSPNSTQRDQMRNQFKKSTSTPSNLWESPTLKLSPQSALMIKNNDSSNSSVWYTPPQIQSPAISSGQSIWDSPTSSILNHSIESFGSADCSVNLLRPQDLSPNDGWYNSGNANKLQSANAFNTFKADSSVWSNTSSSTVGNKIEGNIFTSTPYKSSASPSSSGHDGQKDVSKKLTTTKSSSTAIVNSDTNPASSSCLQLFSDDFINYLNMIN